MPTIDIPDKMCIKCGSTRWRVNPNTGYKRCTDCSNTNSRKNYKKDSHKNKYYKNIDKYRALSKKRQKKYRKSSRDKVYTLHKKYMNKQTISLGDLYVKQLLTKHCSCLITNDITPELIEIKRKQLLLKRKIKQHGKEKTTIIGGNIKATSN